MKSATRRDTATGNAMESDGPWARTRRPVPGHSESATAVSRTDCVSTTDATLSALICSAK